MRLLITGYPGWLTTRFLETLGEYPQDFSSVRCAVHPDMLPKLVRTWECVPAELGDRDALRAAARGCDTVLHAAGVLHVKRVPDFYRINSDGTRSLLEACVAEGVKKFVFISSNAALGFTDVKGTRLNESSPCNPVSHYGKSKYEAEKVVESYRNKIKTVILRPAMFYGPPVPARHLDIYRRMIRKGSFPVFGTGDYLRSVTHVDNLVQAVHLSLRKSEADGKTFMITDRDIPTLNELVLAMADGLGVKVKLTRFPAWMARAAEAVDRVIESTGCYWMLPHIVGESCKNIAYEIDRAEKELGYRPAVNYREGVPQAIEWCIRQGHLK